MTTQHLKTTTILALMATLALTQGCKKDADDDSFRVTEVNPAADTQEVSLDQPIRLTFSAAVDRRTLDASSIRVTADGVDAVGRIMAEGRSLQFFPAQLQPNADYTITITDDVRDEGGQPLDDTFTASFSTGTTLSDGSEPTDPMDNAPFAGQRFIYLTQKVEYVLVGGDYNGTGKNIFAVDPIAFNEPETTDEILYETTDAAYSADVHKLTAAGNLDDDLHDEVAMLLTPATGPATLRVLDTDGTTPQVLTLPDTLGINGDQSAAYNYDLTVGDVDHDGKGEIVVVGTIPSTSDAMLWVFDVSDGALVQNTRLVLEGTMGTNGWTGAHSARVAVGNVEGDTPDSIVVILLCPMDPGHDWVALKIDDLATPYEDLDRHTVLHIDMDPIDPLFAWAMTLANLDGEGAEEIVFGMAASDMAQYMALLGVYSLEDSTLVTRQSIGDSGSGYFLDQRDSVGETSDTRSRIYTIDVDGDHRDEILVGTALLKWDADLQLLAPMAVRPDTNTPASVAVGDVNGDGNEDIILAHDDASIEVWGYNKVQTGYDMEMQPVYDVTWEQIDARGGGAPGQTGHKIVAANLDGDSIVLESGTTPEASAVEQTVDHRVVFSNDAIIAVLAAAPCYNEPWQDDGCSTGIGLTTGGTYTVGGQVEVHVGVSFGGEVESDLVQSKFASKVSFELGLALYGSRSVSVEQTVSDFAGHGEDMVIFYTVPHHQYIYTMTSHPDPTQVGSKMYVNVPMRPRIFSVARQFYNDNNGSQPDVDDSVLSHVPGEPDSYPNLRNVPEILVGNLPLGMTTPPKTVNQTGYSELELTLSAESTVGAELTLSAEYEQEQCVAGACTGFNIGGSISAFAEVTISTATTFSSTVTAIDGEHWADHLYEYGLFAYVMTRPLFGAQARAPFIVVNYYVD